MFAIEREATHFHSFPSAFHPHLHLTPQSERTYPKTGAFVKTVSYKHMTDVPGRKRARKVPRRIILFSRIWDTAWGQRVGVWDRSCGAISAAPAAPLCAPQTDQQPAATFNAPITVRPPVRVKSRKFRNPLLKAQWSLWRMCRNKVRAGEVASECEGG